VYICVYGHVFILFIIGKCSLYNIASSRTLFVTKSYKLTFSKILPNNTLESNLIALYFVLCRVAFLLLDVPGSAGKDNGNRGYYWRRRP